MCMTAETATCPCPLRDFQSGTVQGHDDRRNDQARYDGFRDAIDGRDAQHDVDDVHEGDALCFGIRDADDGRKGTQEENRVTDRRQDRRDGDAPYFADFQMTVQFKGDDADQDTRYDTDEGVGNDIILYSKQQQRARCLQGPDKGKDTEHEADDHADLAACRQAADDSRDMKDRRVHDDQRDETIARKS